MHRLPVLRDRRRDVARKENPRPRPGKRPRRLFDIFDGNLPATPTAHAAAATPPAACFMPAGGVAEPAAPTETVCHSPATVRDAESPVSGDDIDALLGEQRPVASDDEATVSNRGLDDEEIVTDRAIELATAISFESLSVMGFDSEDVLLALADANGDGNVAVECLVSGIPGNGSEEADLGDPSSTPDHEGICGHCDEDDYHEVSPRGEESAPSSQGCKAKASAKRKLQLSCMYSGKTGWSLEISNSKVPLRCMLQLHQYAFQPINPTISIIPSASHIQSLNIRTASHRSITAMPPPHRLSIPISPTNHQPPTNNQGVTEASARHVIRHRCFTPEQKKGTRAPTLPRYRSVTRAEYMQRSVEEGWRDEAP